MPEGDTIAKVAAYMQPRLVGHTLTGVRLARQAQPSLVGRKVAEVRAVGKHLMVGCAPAGAGWLVRVHLGMYGSWHAYPPGVAWKKPRLQASVELHTAAAAWICFNAMEVECLAPHERPRRPQPAAVARLGPDLLAPTCDLELVVRRARALPPATALADVLLDQRVAAGLGNVYKCELLFIHRHHPLTPCGALGASELRVLFASGRALMQANLGGWRRTTTYDRRHEAPAGRPRTWIYSRGGQPCLRCGTRVERAELGRTRRITAWCPSCQRLATAQMRPATAGSSGHGAQG